ncbi:MAG TPA: hypothetical protein P5226_06315 [Candidatus Cloacimonas sp.]|mgnify:FL=1|nr:hypothetical protein [Candidatus Cloacimonas sp.]HRV10961.1 hypothetical protein [Candidatus Cloacimonas sp.]
MESFRTFSKAFCCLMLVLIMISGCTDKKNLTGTNFSNVNAKSVNDKEGIIMGYSYPAESQTKISGSETKLLAGNYQNAVALSFLRFTELPSTIESVVSDSCFLTINIIKRSMLPRNPLKLQLFKLNKIWNDSLDLSNLSAGDLSASPLAEYTITDTIGISSKEITFPLSVSDVFSWSEPDSLGWNFVIKAENEGWVEIASLEGTNKPKLNIKYRKDSESAYLNYSKTPAKDTYTLNAPETTASADWKISNLNSTRLYLKYDPTYTIFRDNEDNILDDTQIKRMTVNKAEVVLHIKNNDYYNSYTSYSLYSFNVIRDSINSPVPLVTGDYEIIAYTVTSTGIIKGDSLTVDVTPIIQAYTSGDKTPKGIMIQSLQERKNFGSLEFWDCNEGTLPEKKPYIKITYTPPFL